MSGRPTIAATLSGRVTRKADGAAISGAIVTLSTPEDAFTRPGAAPVLWVRTDGDGRWSVTLRKLGNYEVTANANGYVPGGRSKVPVSSASQLDDIDLALTEGGIVIEGVVTDSNGGALDRALVIARIAGRDTAFAAATDASGRYALALAEGAYRLQASHTDCASEWKNVKASQNAAINFSLVEGGIVRGRVVMRDTREPVVDAIVAAEGAISTHTDERGAFVMRSLSAMRYTFYARTGEYATRNSERVSITPGQVVDGIELELEPAFSMTGRVVQKGGQGVADAAMVARMTREPWGRVTTSTDARGDFQLIGLQPGDYLVSGMSNAHIAGLGEPLTISDRNVGDVIIEIDLGVTVSGRIEPATAATVGLQLSLEDQTPYPKTYFPVGRTRVESDATGAFSIDSVPDGKYEIVAATADGRGGRLPITVAGVAQSGLVVTVTPRSAIRGRVVDANGKPRQGVAVVSRLLYRKQTTDIFSGVNRTFARSSADGSFKICGLEAGDYLVGTDLKDGSYVHVDGTTERGDVTLVVPAREGVITGQVVDTSGNPVARAHVMATGDERMLGPFDFNIPQATTDSAGRFTLEDLADATYAVFAAYPPGGPKGMRSGIKVGQSTIVTLEVPGFLTIDVMQNGARVPKASISCHSSVALAGGIETDSVPPVTFRELPAAEYDCMVTADGGMTKFKATARPGTDTEIVVDLLGWSSLTGTVVSATTNMPLSDVTVSVEGESSTTTDANGQFILERAPSGAQTVWFFAKRPGFDDFGSDEYSYEASPGQRVGMGTIKVVTPVSDAPGTLGMLVEERGDALVVTNVQLAGPAASAGIQAGDTIVSIDGHAVSDLSLRIARRLFVGGAVSNGQTVTVGLARNITVNVVAVAWN